MENSANSKKGSLTTILILLNVVLVLGLVGMFIYFKTVNKETQKTTKDVNNQLSEETTNTDDSKVTGENNISNENQAQSLTKSYLIYSGNQMVDSGHNIIASNKSIEVNSKKVFTWEYDLGGIDEVYLIGDIIMFTMSGSDGTISIDFINLDGTKIKSLYNFGTEKVKLNPMKIKYNHKITVEDNQILIPTAKYGFSCNSSTDVSDDDLIYATYQIKYLGNGNFSDLKTISSYTKSQICK